MTVGFVIWSIVFLMLVGIGIWTWRSDKAAGFFAGTNQYLISNSHSYSSVQSENRVDHFITFLESIKRKTKHIIEFL